MTDFVEGRNKCRKCTCRRCNEQDVR